MHLVSIIHVEPEREWRLPLTRNVISRRSVAIDESLLAQFAEAAMLGGKTVSHSSLWLLDSWRAAAVASVGEVFS